MSDWRSIDTAPKDGTSILVFGMAYAELADSPYRMWITADTSKPRKPWITIVSWHESWFDGEIDNGDGTYRKERKLSHAWWQPHHHDFVPSHWMPLPSPPAVTTDGGATGATYAVVPTGPTERTEGSTRV